MRYLILLALLLPTTCWGQGATFEGIVNIAPNAIAKTITFVQAKDSASCGNATTCALATTTSNITAGDWLDFVCSTVNPVAPSSISSGGSITDSYVRAGYSQAFHTNFYVYPASAVASSTVITVTFNGSTGGAHCNMRDYTVTGTGFGLDATADFQAPSVASPASHVAMTMTSSKGVLVEGCTGSNNPTHCSAVTVLGNSTFPNDETGQGTGDDVSITSFPSTPSWTLSASSHEAAFSGVLFGFNATACQNYAVLDFSSGTSGNNPTTAQYITSTFGGTDLSTSNAGDAVVYSRADANNALKYLTGAYAAFNNFPRLCNSGATYSAPGTTLGLQWSSTTAAGTNSSLTLTFPGGTTTFTSNAAAVTQVITLGVSLSDTFSCDCMSINAGGDFVNLSIDVQGGVLKSGMEVGAGCSGSVSGPNLSINTAYEFEEYYSAGGKMEILVFTYPGHSSVGSMSLNSSAGCGTTVPTSITLGEHLGQSNTSGQTINFSPAKIGYVGNFTSEIVY